MIAKPGMIILLKLLLYGVRTVIRSFPYSGIHFKLYELNDLSTSVSSQLLLMESEPSLEIFIADGKICTHRNYLIFSGTIEKMCSTYYYYRQNQTKWFSFNRNFHEPHIFLYF